MANIISHLAMRAVSIYFIWCILRDFATFANLIPYDAPGLLAASCLIIYGLEKIGWIMFTDKRDE